MAKRSDITPELCRQLLRYEPDTGHLFWLARPRDMFPDLISFRAWNARYAGEQALNSKHCNNYRIGGILTFRFLAHRVAFAMFHGRWPNEIDHIDGDPSNNRIANLREVTHGENSRNRKRVATNTSGVTGVGWHSRDRVWRAHVGLDGKQIHLGSFPTKEAAIAARQAFLDSNNFSARHGA